MKLQMDGLPNEVADAVLRLLSPYSEVSSIAELKTVLSNDKPGDKIMTQKEAENFTRLSFWTLRRAEKTGKIRVLRAGRKRLYKQSDLEKYLMGE